MIAIENEAVSREEADLHAELSAIDGQLEDLRRLRAALQSRRVETMVALRGVCRHARGTSERSDGDYHRPRRWRVCVACGEDLPWSRSSAIRGVKDNVVM